jgi:hypothetical protein
MTDWAEKEGDRKEGIRDKPNLSVLLERNDYIRKWGKRRNSA